MGKKGERLGRVRDYIPLSRASCRSKLSSTVEEGKSFNLHDSIATGLFFFFW
jgi:hypothetical protein